MVRRAKGSRQKTRKKLRKSPRSRGKISVTRFLQEFKEGEKVLIDPEPSF
ncbi:MAG: 50S ribosomal protein L21e, partial [Nanoarchaeota archaeon]|nr:50S ribosomal protein L21e [Nanoarchaeota archaeon]